MKRDRRWLATCLGGVILTGVYIDHSALRTYSADADAYHARVKAAAKTIPYAAGTWIGADNELPAGAVALLRPNYTLSREYVNSDGKHASFLLVQCRDARDLLGHYPPVCYVAHGFVMAGREQRDWVIDGDTLHGTMYEFRRFDRDGRENAIKVYDVMILPNGKTAPDMAGVDKVARQRRQRYFGAAQIQILTDSAMPEDARTEAIELLLKGAKPMIDAIKAGVTP